MPLLDNKVCVAIGGAGSIGLASAGLFLREAELERALRSLASPNAGLIGGRAIV